MTQDTGTKSVRFKTRIHIVLVLDFRTSFQVRMRTYVRALPRYRLPLAVLLSVWSTCSERLTVDLWFFLLLYVHRPFCLRCGNK
jgi:hypothetical protein